MGKNESRKHVGRRGAPVLAVFSALLLAASPATESMVSGAGRNAAAAVQFTPAPGQPEKNRERLAGLISKAARQGARYIVLPELSLVAGEPWEPSLEPEPVPGPTTQALADIARRLGVWIVASVPEHAAGGLYVTTVLLDDRGEVTYKHRQVMPAGPGVVRGNPRAIIYTVDDHGRRLGILGGADLQAGVPRLANLGAETILVATSWSPQDGQAWGELSRQLSRQHRVDLVVANRGEDGGTPGPMRLGGIYRHDGTEVHPAGQSDGEAVVAELPRRSGWRIPSALGLPSSVPVPRGEEATPEIAELGRMLFTDRRLSSTGTVSCTSCHQPERAFSNGQPRGEGVLGRRTGRNVPSLLNVAYRAVLQWDGYASSLENQAKYPVSGFNEMDFNYLDRVQTYLRSNPEYSRRFRETMGVETITFDDVARALATYERTLISGNSPFDRYQYGGEAGALSEAAKRGLALFIGKARCSGCHKIGVESSLFTDFAYHDLGVGYDSRTGYSDPGVGKISHDDKAGLFLTPSLRNVAETAPYMHDGSLATLEAVVEFYNHGGNPGYNHDPYVKPLGLSREEINNLVEFLRSLTGDHRFSASGKRLDREPLETSGTHEPQRGRRTR